MTLVNQSGQRNYNRVSILARSLCVVLLWALPSAMATPDCEDALSGEGHERAPIDPKDVAAFERARDRFFQNTSVSSAELLATAERLWRQSGVHYERTQIKILDQQWDALKVAIDSHPTLLNQLAVKLRKGYLWNLVYSPDFMRFRHANAAFSEGDNLFLLPHESVLRPGFRNYIVKHEFGHFEAYVRRFSGQAILSDGAVKAKDGLAIWSQFKSDRGRYKATFSTEEGDLYPKTYGDLLEEIKADWPSLSRAHRRERLLDLRVRVAEGTEVSRQAKYVYAEVEKIFAENPELNGPQVTVTQAMGNRAQSGYGPVTINVVGSTFSYGFSVPAKNRTANIVGLYSEKDWQLTPEFTAEMRRDINKVVKLKFTLLQRLADSSLLRGPKILAELDRILKDQGLLGAEREVLDRLEIEIQQNRQALDRVNEVFDRYVEQLVPTPREISRIAKLKLGGPAEKMRYLNEIIRLWNIGRHFLPEGTTETIRGWLLDPSMPKELRKKCYAYIEDYEYSQVSKAILSELSPATIELLKN